MVEALLFSMAKHPVQYEIRPMTRSLTSKLAKEFERDFPQLLLVQWREDDTESIKKCFDGCYGAFINTGMFAVPEASILELTRGEIALGKRCLEAAKVSVQPSQSLTRKVSLQY